MGVAEASIVPAFLLSMSMFFTYHEQAVMMPIMWSIGNASPITSGLLSYGVLWIDTGSFSPWKWFMGMWPGYSIQSNSKFYSSYHRCPYNYLRWLGLSFLSRQPASCEILDSRGTCTSDIADQREPFWHRAETVQKIPVGDMFQAFPRGD